MMKCISILEVNYVQPKKVIYRRHTSISQILELFKSKGVNRSRNGQRREAQSCASAFLASNGVHVTYLSCIHILSLYYMHVSDAHKKSG
jgi:hypothetical protein